MAEQPRNKFHNMSARRLLIVAGITLIVAGMIFGDVFAVFVLHQNANRIGESLMSATDAVALKDPAAINTHFTNLGSLLENRGTKVDTHVHAIDFGYLALLLALIQPYVALTERTRKRLAQLFIVGAVLLPVSVFLIHYVGLKYSPLTTIGIASIAADTGGLLVIIACVGELIGLRRYGRRAATSESAAGSSHEDRGWASRVLLTGGTMLILAGFLHGAFYAVVDLQRHEMQDQVALETMINASAAQQTRTSPNMKDAHSVVEGYGLIQAEKAVNIAAHSHLIEFGLLAILLALIQQRVSLSEPWKRRWAVVMLTGSIVLPVFVLLELRFGLVAGGLADLGGLLVIIAVAAMLAGVLRATGTASKKRSAPMSVSGKLLIGSGVVLAIWGMSFGLYYALFAEHQALEKIGSSIATGFAQGAAGDLIAAHDAIQTYADTQFDYVRSVDVHSHWIGLAMLLIVFGVAFNRLGSTESRRLLLASLLAGGSVAFPLGVILQTLDRGIMPQAVAGIGAGLVIIALGAVAPGFARSERDR